MIRSTRKVTFGSTKVHQFTIPNGSYAKYKPHVSKRKNATQTPYVQDPIGRYAAALRNAMEMARSAGYETPFGVPVVWYPDQDVYVFQPYENPDLWHALDDEQALALNAADAPELFAGKWDQ